METRTTQTSDADYGGDDRQVLKIPTILIAPADDFHFQAPSTRGLNLTFQSPALFDRLKNCHIKYYIVKEGEKKEKLEKNGKVTRSLGIGNLQRLVLPATTRINKTDARRKNEEKASRCELQTNEHFGTRKIMRKSCTEQCFARARTRYSLTLMIGESP